MACLGFEHVNNMLDCPHCQALVVSDRLERARRFVWWRTKGTLLSAREMRKLLIAPEGIPSELAQERLCSFYQAPLEDTPPSDVPIPVRHSLVMGASATAEKPSQAAKVPKFPGFQTVSIDGDVFLFLDADTKTFVFQGLSLIHI